MKKIFKKLLVVLTTALLALGAVGCGTIEDDHVCGYGFDSIGVQKPLINDHQLLTASKTWASDKSEPTFYAYHMLDAFSTTKEITIGENVYVGICEAYGSVDFSNAKITLPESGNGGLFVYGCAPHGCFHYLDEALPITGDYLDFALLKANLEGNENFAEAGAQLKALKAGEATTAEGLTALTFPAATYALTDAVDISGYLTSGLVTFANPANTNICVNNQLTTLYGQTSKLEALNNSIETLKGLGVNVNNSCKETVVNPLNATHNCPFVPQYEGLNVYPLSQAFADELTGMLANLAAAGQTMPVSPNAWENYVYCYLVEDVTFDNANPVPDGYKLIICTNGFEVECELEGEVYIYDCTPHVCLNEGGSEMIALSTEALRSYYRFVNEVWGLDVVPLPAGNYAVMEYLDFSDIKVVVTEDTEITLCVNEFVDETKYVALENFIIMNEDSVSIDSCIYPLESRHACGELSPHITAIELDERGFAPYLNSDNEFITKGKGVEQAYALTSDIVVDAPIIVPSLAKIQICLNGYSIEWTQEGKQTPGLFRVEYAAELTISDCSGGAGYVVAYPQEGDNNTDVTPVENFGTFTLNGGVLLGNMGVANYGHFVMNGGTLNGVVGGVLQNVATDKETPLHSSVVSMIVRGGVINGAYVALASTTGNVAVENAVLNTGLVGLLANGAGGNVKIGDVDINVSETSMTALREMMSKDFYDQLQANAANLLGTDMYIGMLLTGDITLTGDILIDVEEAMLQPVVKEVDGVVTLVYPTTTDIMLTSNGKLNVRNGVEFTDTYSVASYNDDSSKAVVNKALADVFVPAQGFASYESANGELLILSTSDADFMEAAQLESYNFDLANGRIVFNFYCYFSEEFIENDDARIKIIYGDGKVDEFCVADGEALSENQYLFTVSFMAKDYQKNVKIQFTDGTFAWFGVGNIDPQYIWQNTIGAQGISVKDYLESVIGFKEMYDEKYPEVVAAMEAYYEKLENLEEGEEAPVPPLSEADYQRLLAMGPYVAEYAKVAEAMLAYCEAAAVQFGVEIEEEAKPIQPLATYAIKEAVDRVPNEDEWTNVTAETLAAYKTNIQAGSVMPAGLKIAGISLVLAADTDIRIYFTIEEGYSFDNYTFTVNGKETRLKSYKKENQAFLLISGLSAVELKEMFSVTITDGENTYAFEYGAMSYLYTVLATPSVSSSMKDVARAMWVYATRMENFYDVMGNV